ncbi:hypothetical protein ACFQY4_25790 [Catellatospora bangladeshensis]|uniref:hypothetical protein n=1 Tax=Catellatospora bangladeshensis TaxID=310355 RepID=UPI00361643DF
MAHPSQRRIVIAAAVLAATVLALAVAWGRAGGRAEAAGGEGWVGTWSAAQAPRAAASRARASPIRRYG